jgi:hypothetical protein
MVVKYANADVKVFPEDVSMPAISFIAAPDHEELPMPLKGRIVTTVHHKRPPKKRKAVAIAGPAIVRKRGRTNAVVPPSDETEPTAPQPANDDSVPPTAPAAKPAIATSISRKR